MISLNEEYEERLARHKKSREHYAGAAAEVVQEASDCQFSLLPYRELERTAAVWFDAAHEALMRANYGPLDALIRDQVRVASENGFELNDLVLLLRLLRRAAIEEEGWNEEQLGELDTVVDEAIGALRGQVSWDIPEGLNYLTGKTLAVHVHEQQAAETAEAASERRHFGRNKLRLPIRIQTFLRGEVVDEITRTENVSKGGLYFLSTHPYYQGVRVQVIYPYWDTPGALNPPYEGEVIRIEERPGGQKGIAVRFFGGLGKRDPGSPG